MQGRCRAQRRKDANRCRVSEVFLAALRGFARETFSCHRSSNVTLGFFFCKASNLINQTNMNDLGQRIARLSPEKRALLVQRLAPLSFAQQRMWMLEQSQPGSL